MIPKKYGCLEQILDVRGIFFLSSITDDEDPRITCPNDIVMDTDAGQSYALIALPALINESDNVGLMHTRVTALSSTYEEGDTLQFAYQETPPHTVVYHAVDHAGNEATCQITVTITGEYRNGG